MVAVLLDSCILIDYLNGSDKAEEELSRYVNKSISIKKRLHCTGAFFIAMFC